MSEKKLVGELELNRIYQRECIEGMRMLPDKSVDMILCDLPYGTTACKWDTIIPFEDLWREYERLIKDNGAIVLTASQPFTSALVMSNPKLFRYEWIWEKDQGRNFQLAKKQPLKITESVLVFYKKFPTYNPQGLIKLDKPIVKSNKGKGGNLSHLSSESKRKTYVQEYTNYPKNLFKFNSERGLHPTQKPIDLFAYLIRTYTNEDEIVLDNCMGSGTTAVAAVRTNRNFIGFEREPAYVEIANKRLDNESEAN
ncbi:site-specific DNA-methyltransferase [Listeria monocytogenes]|nr:site-specific DNA-methyltransferase [Listeria monocytogenes]